MKHFHPKYKIKEEDTIQSITELFGSEKSVWTRYHNNMCRLDNVIREDLPKHLEEIYLLPELWDSADTFNARLSLRELKEKSINQKVLFGYDNTFVMKYCPETLYYGVMIALFTNDKVDTVKYEVGVRWITKNELIHIIEINRNSKVYINDQEPNLIADVLASKVSSILYPIELVVTRVDGVIGIHNFNEIQKRWENTKQDIKNYYEGKIVEKYLRLNDKTLQSEEALLRSLCNDWFLHAYFNKIYQTYGQEYLFTNCISIPFIFDANGVEYTVQQLIAPTIDEQGFIKIEMNGEFSDKRSIVDLESRLNYSQYESVLKPEGKYYAQYLIEGQYHTIDTLMVDCSLNLSNNKKTSIVISRINKHES